MPDRLAELRAALRVHVIADEEDAFARLSGIAALSARDRSAISARGADLVRAVRASSEPKLMESFLSEYGLSTGEGVALMCLAEALLRVPDATTMDELIRDKIAPHDWSSHSGSSASIFVNASTWALMLTGRVLDEGKGRVGETLRAMIRRLGEPVIRNAVGAAMRELGDQFVLGRTIAEALKRGRAANGRGYTHSFDMLGEAARTEADAARYHRAYADAIAAIAREAKSDDARANPGISVKLSALHPRYETLRKASMLPVLADRLLSLAQAAKAARIGLNIDAEEADRLDLSLDAIEAVLNDASLNGWDGFGVVVQAYGPRAPFVIDWLNALAEKLDRRIMVRLVKGAYWDSEIKKAQMLGLTGFPVFTRKAATDVSYIACAAKLFAFADRIYPQFATHNAHTAAAVLAMAPSGAAFEFQRLHGMGEALHEELVKGGARCRIYAPVGAHEDLLAYLVRRLLENGANSSFVHQIVDEDVAPEAIAADPFAALEALSTKRNPAIAPPDGLFGARVNSRGYDVQDPATLERLLSVRAPFMAPYRWQSAADVAPAPDSSPQGGGGKPTDLRSPLRGGVGGGGEKARKQGDDARLIFNPATPSDIVGEVVEDTPESARAAVSVALGGFAGWSSTSAAQRAAILRRAADLYEANTGEFLALACREAGKTLADAIAELREAVDFLRFYADEATVHPGAARGVIVAISPWNFPLAIFTGQVAAALAAGNAVVAKPAEQTPLIAARAVELLHEAGIPADALQLVCGDGTNAGAPLTADPRIAGVCFTGSTEVARLIERSLAEHAAPDGLLIAETGGINAMIVDSTALPEQAVRDILASAFQSAGQRCSALRVLYVQKDVAAKVTAMLQGAMAALTLGDPADPATDVGPVIDNEAQTGIAAYVAQEERAGRLIARLDAPNDGLFIAPTVLATVGIGAVEREVFGPVLHVATFEADELDETISRINARGYGLTFALHTRIDERVQRVLDRIRAGNVYVNRNQIGAVVGAQPFGGEGLSGTGPKAGGPHYLPRFLKPARLDSGGRFGGAEVGPEHDAPQDAGEWASRTDRVAVLRKLLRGKAGEAVAEVAGLDFGPVDLPGPTGEANTLALSPRGAALCLGPSAVTLLAQAVTALGCGNVVLAIGAGASAALKPLMGQGLPLAVFDGQPSEALLIDGRFDVALCGGDDETLRFVRRALARRIGPIVPLVVSLDAAALCVERTVSVDTTAAGGNASLLAAAG